MTTDQATTVQPATDEQIIEMECMLVAFWLVRNEPVFVANARERLEYWVSKKHGKSAER